MERVYQPEFVFKLEVGDTVHVNGVPFAYIGDGKIAGYTSPFLPEVEKAGPQEKSQEKPVDPKIIEELQNFLILSPRYKENVWFPNNDPWHPLDNTVYGPGCCTPKINFKEFYKG